MHVSRKKTVTENVVTAYRIAAGRRVLTYFSKSLNQFLKTVTENVVTAYKIAAGRRVLTYFSKSLNQFLHLQSFEM
jgi:hypothetical protein